MCWALGKVCFGVHWWYLGLIKNQGGAWGTFSCGVTIFKGTKDVCESQQVWVLSVLDLVFGKCYIRGKENRVVDELKRRLQLCHISLIISYEIDLQEKIKFVGQHDEKYQQLKENIKKESEGEKYKRFDITKDGLIRKIKSRCQMRETWRISY